MSSQCHRSMNDLPEDVMVDIVSRLPVMTIINCKCVCNKWRYLVLDSHFVRRQIQRTPECILIYHSKFVDSCLPPGTLKFLEIENNLDYNRLLCDPFMSLDTKNLFPESIISIVGSVNGLICLWELGDEGDNTCICNPITKQHMILPKQQFDVDNYWDLRYGFGVSAMGEYKVIRIWRRGDPSKIEVYTLGTEKWRTLGSVPYCEVAMDRHGVFFNNHVHWTDQRLYLYSFNLNDETFQLSPLPPLKWNTNTFLGVLKGCLSLFSWSDNLSITIWVMKKHGIEKSWHKELEIQECTVPYPEWYPISLIDGLNGRSFLFFEDDIEEENPRLLAYCLETNQIEDTTLSDNLFTVISYRPSSLELHNFRLPQLTSSEGVVDTS